MNRINSKLANFSILVIALSLVFALIGFGAYQFNKVNQANIQGRTMTLTAEGKVNVMPDIAKINFEVSLENESIEELTNENNQKMQSIIDYLKSLNINEKDIKTVYYNLMPIYEQKCYFDVSSYHRCDNILARYKLNQRIEVIIRDFNIIDELITEVSELGVTNISNLSFEVEDLEKVQNEAKIDAINKITVRAQEISKNTNVKFGRIINISEGGYFYPMYDARMSLESMPMASKEAAKAPIEPGTKDVTSQISITFEIR